MGSCWDFLKVCMNFSVINICKHFEMILVLDVSGLPNFKCNLSSLNIEFHDNQSSCYLHILLKDTNNNLMVAIENKSREDISSGDQECLYRIQWQPVWCFLLLLFFSIGSVAATIIVFVSNCKQTH